MSSPVQQAKQSTRPRNTRSSSSARALRIGAVLELLARALNGSNFESSSVAVVNEKVCAISNTVDIEHRQLSVRAIASAMQEALQVNSIVEYPVPGTRAQASTLMHSELANTSGSGAILTIPLVVRGEAVGALLFEREERFDSALIESAKDAACFVGPVLEVQYRASQPIRGKLLARRERLRKQSSRFPVSGKEIAIASVCAMMLLAALWPVTLRVSSPARVEGAGQRIVSAPVDGYIKSVERRPGEKVKAGQLLVTLDSTDLAQTVDKWKVEYAKLDREYGDALGQEDAAAIVVARARLAQVRAQVEQSERELARSALVAPIDGVVVSSGLDESIGMPVKLGQELVTVAPEGAYRIVAEIDEQDVAMINAGQNGNVVFAALANQHLPVSVTRISPVARTIEQRNSFEVDAELENRDVLLYHGLTGVARIDIEKRPLAAVVWLRVAQRAQRLFWRLVG